MTSTPSAFRFNPGVLRSLPLFSGMRESTLRSLLRAVKVRRYRRHEYIIAGGTPSGLFLLLTGRVKTVFEDSSGHELTLDVLGPNQLFGELSVIGGDSSASVIAMEPCDVLHVPRHAFRLYLMVEPKAAMLLLNTIGTRLRAAHRKIAALGLMNVFGRVASLMVEAARDEDGNGEVTIGLGSEEIARMVGASREMVSRVLTNMRRQGLIRRAGRRIVVRDREALARAISAPPRTAAGRRASGGAA